MKMKKGLLMVVLLLALSSVMAAMSFTSAAVENNMSVTLGDTDGSLLALTASNEHNAAYYGSATSRQLEIDLNKGNKNGHFGIQANSVYTWDDLFMVTNHSEHSVKVTIRTNPAEHASKRIEVLAGTNGSDWKMLLGIHSPGTVLSFNLAAGESKEIDFKTKAKNGRATTSDLKLIVEAQKN